MENGIDFSKAANRLQRLVEPDYDRVTSVSAGDSAGWRINYNEQHQRAAILMHDAATDIQMRVRLDDELTSREQALLRTINNYEEGDIYGDTVVELAIANFAGQTIAAEDEAFVNGLSDEDIAPTPEGYIGGLRKQILNKIGTKMVSSMLKRDLVMRKLSELGTPFYTVPSRTVPGTREIVDPNPKTVPTLKNIAVASGLMLAYRIVQVLKKGAPDEYDKREGQRLAKSYQHMELPNTSTLAEKVEDAIELVQAS